MRRWVWNIDYGGGVADISLIQKYVRLGSDSSSSFSPATAAGRQQHASTPNTNWQMCGELLLPNDEGDDSEEWISGAETCWDGLLGCLRRRRCSRVLQRFSWTGKSHGGGGCLAVLSHAGRGRRLACGAHGPGRLWGGGVGSGRWEARPRPSRPETQEERAAMERERGKGTRSTGDGLAKRKVWRCREQRDLPCGSGGWC